jgi:hypothetical protein
MKGTIKIYTFPINDEQAKVSIDVSMDEVSAEDRGVLVMNLMQALDMSAMEQKLLGLALLTVGAKAPVKESNHYDGDSEEAAQARAELEAMFGKGKAEA